MILINFLELNLFSSTKAIIINEDNHQPNLISLLTDTKIESKNCFKFASYKHDNKTINLFECSEVNQI